MRCVTCASSSSRRIGQAVHQDALLYRFGPLEEPDARTRCCGPSSVDLAGRGITKEAVGKISSIVWKIDTNPEPASALGIELQKVKA